MTGLRRVAPTLLVLAFAASACGGTDPDATEVLGIQVDRDPAEITAPTEPEATAPPAVTSPAPEATAAPEPVDVATEAPALPTRPAEPSPPPPPPPPPPYELASEDGRAGLVWSPAMEEDSCCWIEISSDRVDRDDGRHRAVAGRLFDAVPAEPGQDPVERQQRWATCDPVLTAPSDRTMRVRGTLTASILAGDTVIATRARDIDDTFAAGQAKTYPRVDPVLVDAADGQSVRCTVRFDAA